MCDFPLLLPQKLRLTEFKEKHKTHYFKCWFFSFFTLVAKLPNCRMMEHFFFLFLAEPLNRTTVLIIKMLPTLNPDIFFLSLAHSSFLSPRHSLPPSLPPHHLLGIMNSLGGEFLKDPMGLEFDNSLFLFWLKNYLGSLFHQGLLPTGHVTSCEVPFCLWLFLFLAFSLTFLLPGISSLKIALLPSFFFLF